jgi:hypothetical protein
MTDCLFGTMIIGIFSLSYSLENVFALGKNIQFLPQAEETGSARIESMNCACAYTTHMREHSFESINDQDMWKILKEYTM